MDKRKITRIKNQERKRLENFLQDAPISTKGAVESIIEELCDIKAYMAEVKELLNETGFVEEYQNGANQRGKKKSVAFEVLNTLQKNYGMLQGRLSSLIVATVMEDDINANT